VIGDEALRRVERDLDLEELRLEGWLDAPEDEGEESGGAVPPG
jgi:hypothetical protein